MEVQLTPARALDAQLAKHDRLVMRRRILSHERELRWKGAAMIDLHPSSCDATLGFHRLSTLVCCARDMTVQQDMRENQKSFLQT
jgi:hypothetical protein